MASLPYTTNLKLYLRSRSMLAPHNGGSYYWYDDSDAGTNDFSEVSYYPTFLHNQQNRRPAFSFNGSTQFMTGPAASSIVANNAKSIFIAFSPTAFTAAAGTMVGNPALLYLQGCGIVTYSSGGVNYVAGWNDDGGGAADFRAIGGLVAGQWYTVGFWHNGSAIWLAVDDLDSLTASAASGNSAALGSSRLGRNGGAVYNNCLLGEVIAYNAFINPQAADNSIDHMIMEYLRSEWKTRGNFLAQAQDIGARRLHVSRYPISGAAFQMNSAGLDLSLGEGIGIADDALAMPNGINPSRMAVEPWRRDAIRLANQSIVFKKE